MAKTTKKDFEVFKEEARKWINIFGLISWEVEFEHKNINEFLASVSFDADNRCATLYLSPDWGQRKISDYEIKRTAFHESCELLMCGMRRISERRFITLAEIDTETHRIIRTLENVLWEE